MKPYPAIILLLFSSLCLAACTTRTHLAFTPLPQPTLVDAADPLGDIKNGKSCFIFKGKITKITEVNVRWEDKAGNETITLSNWLSVCDVEIENVLHGAAPGGKDTVRVVFGQSTRTLDPTEFRLGEGGDYYFITHLFGEEDRRDDRVRAYELGDAMGGTFYSLFPVEDGTVSFQGWPFEGASPAAGAGDAKYLGRIVGTIDEESFLEQFGKMVEEAGEQRSKKGLTG